MRPEQILLPMIRFVAGRPRLAELLLGRDRWGNPLSPEAIADPYTVARRSLPDGPVVYRGLYQQWFIQGYDEIREALTKDDLAAGLQVENLLTIRPYNRLSEQSRFFFQTLLPITDRHVEYALKVRDALEAAGIRVELDDRSEKLGFKIREAELQKVPVMAVIGDQEKEQGTVTPRFRRDAERGGEAVSVDAFVSDLSEQVARRQV